MKRGCVIGEIWASRRVADLAGRSLKLVVTASGSDANAAVDAESPPGRESARDVAALAWESLTVAIDTLDARVGQDVLVAYGSGARNVLAPGPNNRHLLCDAAVALLVDPPSPSGEESATGPDAGTSRPSPHVPRKAG